MFKGNSSIRPQKFIFLIPLLMLSLARCQVFWQKEKEESGEKRGKKKGQEDGTRRQYKKTVPEDWPKDWKKRGVKKTRKRGSSKEQIYPLVTRLDLP